MNINPEAGSHKPEGEKVRPGPRSVAFRLLACGFWLLPAVAGCESGPKQKTTRERQDEAMRDPFRYKPNWDDAGSTSGDTKKLDKQGFKRDFDHVLMP